MSNTTSKLDQLSPEQRRLLALRLKQRKADEPRPSAADEGAGGEYPLAFTQQRLWMLDRLQPGSAAYNMPSAARFKQPLDAAVAERAIGEIVRRHGTLRTRFEERDGGPVQVVEPFTGFHLPVHDLSALPDAEREAELVRIAVDEAQAPFALERGAFRAKAVRLGPADLAVLATVHHIVSDGWSLSVFWREFEELVAAFGAGVASPLPPLPVQFGEHARRERERLSGPALDDMLAWWRRELQGAPTLLELPTDHPRPAVATQRGAAYVAELDASLAERVGALALREGTTPFNVLLAVFQLLVGRYADTDDLLVGTAIAGRRTRDVEPLIGFFANTLVLRGDLSGEPTFRQLLARVHAATLAAFEHQDLPFERLVEEMAPERTLAYSPLVQAVFVQQTSHPDQGRDTGDADDSVQGVHQELNAAKFDLNFAIAQDGGRTWAGVEYAADLFERPTIERMVRHYATLLDSALADPDALASALEMMPAEERDAVRAMGAAVAHHPVSTTLHDAFAAQAARTPHAPALTFGGQTLTYAELDAHAEVLARRLRARGVGADVLVGLCVERSLETVAGILGILKAGAAYLPLDPAYPDDRLAYMLDDSGARLVVTAGDAAGRLPSSIELIRMDVEEPRGRSEDFHTNLTPAQVSPDALAYVIYTSGSTGRPKGVQVTHANVVRLMAATDPWFGFGADDVWTLFHSYAFDFSVWEIWGALLYGGRLVVVPFEVSRDPARFHALLRDERVTVLNQTPSAFRQLIRADDDAAAAGDTADLALRYVIFGGEALDPASLRPWVDRRGADRPRLVNMYGITETTVHVTWRVISEDDVRGGSASPIGVPIPDLSVHLLDRRGRIVPIGLAGEMYVGGGGVARGYLHRPELTARRFVPDPFSDKVADRLYRSGDLARRRADGSLEFLGRADDQVKVRGFRIELGEIESVLLEHPAVREAVVLARGAGDDRRLVAWTVASAEVTAAELRAHLLAHLPEYMVPSAFVLMDRLPLTRNGKTDRRALPEPDAADVAGAEYVAPRTQTQQVIAALWEQLLGVERVGATDRFFDLGGQSLLATRAVSRVREALGVEVPVRAVFEHAALESFAAEVDRLLRAATGVEAPPIRPADRSRELPLSFAQERLWFIDRLEPGNPVYNMPFPVRMRGPLDVPALERAIGQVVRRHEVLRTRLETVDGHPVQRIEPAVDWHLPVDPMDGEMTDDGREAELARRVAEWARMPFDLERGPLFRARLLRMDAADHVLLVGMHHVASDGWSMNVFWHELAALYRAFAAGQPSPLPRLPIQYADFAVWQREWLRGEALDRQVAWWRAHLAGAPALLELPTDRPRPAVQSYRGDALLFAIPSEVAEPVRVVARRAGATLFMALLSAWQVLLSRWSGQDDVVVGTPVAGRTRGETEGLIGFFVNTLAVRGDLSGDPTFLALLARVREAALGAFAHQDLPFERLVQELQPERSLGHAPLFQAMLTLQNVPDTGEESFADELTLEGVGGGGGVAKVDISLQVAEADDGGLHVALEWAADLWDRATMERMAGHFVSFMRAAAEQPDAPVSALTMMDAEERGAVLSLGVGLAQAYGDDLVHRRFAAQAARAPDAVALSYPGGTMTYGQLDRRANALAHRLRGLGVGPEVRVGLHLERGPGMVAAILGVLKAGGAYLPLDPAYPAERLSYMLGDSGATVLLTQAGRAELPVPPGVAVVALDDAAEEREDAPQGGEAGGNLAYVLYTSGSTGRPKGVAVEHAPLAAYLAWATRTYPGRNSAVHSSLSFDLTVTSLFVPLLTGGSVELVEEADAVEMLGRRLTRDEPYAMLKLTPTHLRVLGDRLPEAGGGAECLVVGGEALLGEALRPWRERYPSTTLVNEYGPTETVVGCCIDVRTLGDVADGRIPIGRAAPNIRLYVLDGRMQPVPVGVPGELYIGGAQVARGYLGRPALTADRFVPDPLGADAGARMYRTGDRVLWRADGALDYLGRLDEQVKVRGFRIELGEIEGALRRHPAVADCAVVVREDVPGDARIVAYVAGPATADELRAHLRGTLPDYMVPGAFVAVDALPLTPNGKLDRRALPAPDLAAAADRYVAPRTPVEEVLASLWTDVLRVERVGVHDRFFDLGGHSLLATRLCSGVRERLGVEVPVRAVFEHPSLEAFAGEVDRLLRASAGVEAPPIRPADRTGDLPLSFAQERLWFVDRLEPGSAVYHMPSHHLLRGPLDVDALHRALSEIVRRHETLRTALPFTGEQPVQRILPPAPVDLPLHDVSAIADEAERDAATEAVMRDVATRAFDLERGPLFRAALVRTAADEHVLSINLHHVVSDGWSAGVLWSELSALYAAYASGAASPLPEPALQYGDFAVWQRAWLSGDVLRAQLGYWRRKLAVAPPLLELPTDRPRPAVQTYAGAAESVLLDGDDAAAVLALGRREGSTLFMVLLAAMDVVFGRLAGQDDVVIGTPIAGRTRAETEGMIGLFLNSLALRSDLSGEPTFRELLRRVRETTLEAYAHQDLPFERILEELAPERSLSHSPLFQVMLNLSNFAEGDVDLPGLEVQAIGGAGELASKFDLTLYAGEAQDGIYLHLVYNTALFDAPRVRSMLAQLTGVLRQAAEDANLPIHAYSLLTDDAAAVLPDPAAPLSPEWRGSVPAIFARHAARTPDAVAVEDPAERWTYAELDAASTAIAHRLMADGVRPGDVVAILGHRSAALVRALLGTMKAGAAFLILDPAYPPARLAEYVRIARPTGFLPIEAAGDIPAEVADALRESVVSTLVLRAGHLVDEVAKPADAHQPPPGFFGGGASLSERRGCGGSDDAGFADKVANSADAPQPPPAVLGEVGEVYEPGGGALGASGYVDKVADIPFPEIGPDSLAYLSFTSGTTGKPKAVMGRHGSLTHFTQWLAERFELRASDRFSLLSGLAHDPLHRDVFTPLQLGAAVVAPDPEEVGTPGYLAQWMADAGITVSHLTPAMGQLLVDIPGGLGEDASASNAVLPLSVRNERGGGRGEGQTGEGAPRVDSLRRAFFVGDVLTRTDVGRMHRLAPNLQVINYYGSTETQRAVAHFVVPRDLTQLARETIPVGIGIPDVQVLIRNAAGERTGVGEVGEIWMRSPHVALGYLGDPELTASRFVANPWTGDAADPTYRTGDLGRYRPDGVAEIAGRADQQVKIRGFRIEPGEIEAALRAHAAVRDVVVVPRGEGDGKRLVAYVVADGEPAPGELREWLRASVPEYMVPAAWMFLPALPVTPNGKVDRKALPGPPTEGDARGFVPPRTPTEVALADVWAALLNAERVGADDDFFALGGHSLLATKLVARVRDAFRVELPLRALFESPTLGALAAAVDRLLRADDVAAPPPILHRPHDGTAPASFAQERLWFVDRMEGGGGVYHIPNAQLLTGPVDPEALRRAVEEVVRRHETLRTALPEVDGMPVQRISPQGRVEMPFIDLTALSDEDQRTEAARLAECSANEPFHLETGPLFRASLVRLADDEHLLLVNLHHAIGDGWSMRVLLDELSALHAAYRRGEPSPLPPLPVQYADYARWQREWLAGPVLEAQLGYWRGRLAGAPPLLALPTDRPRPETQGHAGASEVLLIGADDAARVAEMARREGATVFMVLLAALNVVLARWAGQDDVVVGTPVAGRTRSELEGLIGLFLNSLALRTELDGDPSFRQVLARVRESTLGAYAHQDVPFERILEDLKPERSLGHTPVFQVMLNLLNYRDGDGAGPDGEMTSLGAGTQVASKFDLTVYAAETPEGIPLHAVYDAALFDAARMRSLLAQVAAVLRQAADDADRPAHALSLVTEEDRPRVDSPSSPVVVRNRARQPAGVGELGEVWMRGPDGTLRPMGGAGRYRPDGSVELATAAPASPPSRPVEAVLPSPRGTSGKEPLSSTERAVAAIWAEVLGMDTDAIAADADFFALGGHSLRATQVLSRIRARLGAKLPIRAFFTAPTVAALATAIDAQAPSVSTEPAAPAQPPADALTHSRTHALTHFPPGVYPLSFAQQRLWVLMRLGSTAAYHLASALRMAGPLDEWALERALDEIVRRHETLRTRVEERDGEPVQVVQPARPLRLRVEDVRPAAGESTDDALRRMAEEEAARPFAPNGPFLRVRLLRAGDDDHLLLWTLHHLMADGWSLGIFRNELLTLYRAFATEAEPALQPLPVQYGEHALAQRRELSGGAVDRLVEWWRERLAGAPALLELPADHPRPAQPSGDGASFWFGFPEGTAQRVGRFARERGATPFMVLLAAFQALLARWSGQDDVVVGTPIANRTRAELEPLIGLFVNTLAIRGRLDGDPTFRDLLARVREATLGAYEHQDVPFERLVEELNPERSLSHSPVFQVMFALQNTPAAEGGAELEGLALSGLSRARETSQYDLSLALHEMDDGLAARLEYATDLFVPGTMERFAAHFVRLLDAALDDPDRPVVSLSLLDDDERAQLLEGFAGPRVAYAGTPLHAQFAQQAARTPDAPAVVFRDEVLTYAELDARANRLARHLRARGAGPEVRVGICLERSPQTVVALLAVLKAGAAYLPLDPAYPADRLAYMLEDTGAPLLVTQSSLRGLLPAQGVEIVLVDEDAAAIEAEATDAPDFAVDAANVAYVIYTSGSTGRPKGVVVTHANAASFLAGMDERLSDPQQRPAPDSGPLFPIPYSLFPAVKQGTWLAVTRISFDIHVLELLWTLVRGFRVVVQPEVEQARSGESLAAQIRRHGVTHLQCTPPLAEMLLTQAGADALRGLRHVLLGGEALSPELAARIAAVVPDGLLNMYGPTETTVWDTMHRVDAGAAGPIPIGRPIANTRAYVLDAAQRLQPAGVPGELYLAGPGVTRGYHGRPGLTAERFLPDAFGGPPGARMYRTGDRARWRPDGTLEFMGRADFQLKVRGFRIEPGEIEAALRQDPTVKDAVVIAVDDERLVAYLTPRAGKAVAAEAALRERLSRTLPDYMVPSAFVALDALPLTPNGKVDRRALPRPDAPPAGGYVVPRDVTELEVARIWSEALGVARVGAADDFFRLGGHSLLALRMMARIRERFGRELPLAALFRGPTVAAFAGELRREGADADDGRLLVTLNVGGALPPLFFFPPAGGTVTHYADLARRLGPEQPFLALHAPGLTGAEEPLERVEAMAARYLEEIRAAQSHGPYWLGGWSAGGTVAFEAARQLRDAGEEVALVAMVDPQAPDGAQAGSPPTQVELFRDYARSIVTEDQALLAGLVDELRVLPAEEQLAGLSRWIARHGGQVMDTELERVGRAIAVFAATARAVRAYRDPPPFDGPVALFVASQGRAEDGKGPELLPRRWRPFVRGELFVHVIPGAHAELVLDPAAAPLAAHLGEVMQRLRDG
jgi:amino acid adenylation domain-containing protein